MLPIEVIINAAGGSFVEDETYESIAAAFSEKSIDVNIHLARSGDEIADLAKKAASGDAPVIVGCGGDGTIALIAGICAASSKTLGIIPLGTLNHFSKDLDIPQDINGAVTVLADGIVRRVDVGEVNGRTFINNSSIGIYPQIVLHREAQQERLGRGKWSAAALAALRVFRRSPFLRVKFELDGVAFVRRVPFVFIGNNVYEMDLYNIGTRKRLDGGLLSVYFLHRGGRLGVLELLFRTLTGRLRQWRDFEAMETDELTIDTRKSKMIVACDGEVEVIETPLNYRIRPRALSVIVPKEHA